MNKTIVIGGIIFLLAVGGIFLYLVEPSSPELEEEYSTTPTTWGQEEDYLIEEIGGRTKVTNTNADFSFLVPEGWVGGIQEYEPKRFLFEMTSPDARAYEGQVILEKGCAIAVTFKYEPDSIEASVLKATIEGKLLEEQEVISIGGYQALKTTDEWFGTLVAIQVPVNNDILIIDGEFQQEHCFPIFEDLLDSFVIG